MHEAFIEKLRCPQDLQALTLDIQEQADDGHIITGRLTCDLCNSHYPIEHGVPHLIPDQIAVVQGQDLQQLQEATVERFGFEWRYFRDWGWLEDYPDVPNAEEKFYGGLLAHSESAFWSKSLFTPEDLGPGVSVLDGGCGNGRFSYQAGKTGAEVAGIDLGWGVYSAFEHTRHMPNVHIARADMFRLPFADATFDRAFSIGVLMHTGDAEAGFASMLRTVRPGGLILAHVYGTGIHSYETIDAVVRAIITRLPIGMQIRFARLTAAIARWLRGGGERRSNFYKRLYYHINLLPTEHHMYDWWAAPIATHHTSAEVLSWFDKHNLEIVRTLGQPKDPNYEAMRRLGHGPITVLGQRPGEA